ncbi:MAG: mandelate racemase [Alphaproteobacteria bacterium]|nr:mandelate racemase [Alphaproteobacteria bacterium]MCZ6845546.1 mandelate racemase [Alphaproteobacteria bacterium]
MQINSIEVIPVRLPLKSVVTLSRGVSRTIEEGKQIILVKLTADDGTVGWGEAGPSRRWSAETTHSCYTTIKHYLAPIVVGRDPFDIAGLHEAMNTELAPGLDPGQPVAKAAIDLAVHDLICKHLGINLQSWIGAKGADRIELSYLVSAPGPDEISKVVQAGLDQGFRSFKVKVGHDPDGDITNMRTAMEVARDCVVWPDANQGYTLDQALRAARGFEALGVELFEQPIPMTDVYGMKKLLSATSMNISLDEAAMGLPFVIELIRREAVEGLVIKVNKVGGIHYGRQLCDLAHNAGFKLIGSGLMDAPIGFAASVHLFAAYGIDFPADLNGPQHIAEDYSAKPLPMDGQFALVPNEPGLGVTMDEDKIAEFAIALD